jgi:rhodanese-related sulfurtransferase
MIYLIPVLLVVAFHLYKRYFPVLGVNCYPLTELDLSTIEILDVRDYNESYKSPIEGSINIPIAYFKRNINKIPHRDLHLAVSSLLEKNVGIRTLKKKGYRVVGYTFVRNNELKKRHLEIQTYC